MKICKGIILLIITILVFHGCSSSASPSRASSNIDGFDVFDELDIRVRGAIGRLDAAVSGPMFTGDGGGDIRLAILAPEVDGDVPGYLPFYIQGLLNNNFNRFSAITLVDRQNLDRIIADQNLTATERFSDQDFISIGRVANAQYLLLGTIQRLSENRYSLQLRITEAITGIIRADSMKDGTLTQFEGRATLLNQATSELLSQLGVQLTEAGFQTLLAGNISTVQAQAGLARGIAAQTGGSEIEALFNFAQAITFDSSQIEALSRLNTLSTNISSGSISERIHNDLLLRNRWLEVFRETARFFNNHPPFEIIFDPNLIQIGETDFRSHTPTATLGMRILLDSSDAGFTALNALLEGLERTGRREAWLFSGWPFVMNNLPHTQGTEVFGDRRSFSYKVDVALVNENNKIIGNSSITLNTEEISFSPGDKTIKLPFGDSGTVLFSDVKADQITPTLTIVIVAVNGISSRNLSASGYMRIETGELEKSGHSGEIYSVAFSPDGKQIISSSRDGTIKLWDAATGRIIQTFRAHSSSLFIPAVSPDGRQIISGDLWGLIKLWDVATGNEIRTFRGHSRAVYSVAFSPDGRTIISGSEDNTIKIWETATGSTIRTLTEHTRSVSYKVAFSPNGRQFISGDDSGTIRLWETATGNLIRTYGGHTNYMIRYLAFSPDGRQIFSGCAGSRIILRDAATDREIRSYYLNGTVNAVTFSPDGKQIFLTVMTGSHNFQIFDVNTGNGTRRFTGESTDGHWHKMAFSPDGRQIVSGSTIGTIKLWDVATGNLIRTIGNHFMRTSRTQIN